MFRRDRSDFLHCSAWFGCAARSCPLRPNIMPFSGQFEADGNCPMKSIAVAGAAAGTSAQLQTILFELQTGRRSRSASGDSRSRTMISPISHHRIDFFHWAGRKALCPSQAQADTEIADRGQISRNAMRSAT